jgi:hypothetical protein
MQFCAAAAREQSSNRTAAALVRAPSFPGAASYGGAPASDARSSTEAVVVYPSHVDVSPPMRSIPTPPPTSGTVKPAVQPEPTVEPLLPHLPYVQDPVVQRASGPDVMPAATTFEGLRNEDNSNVNAFFVNNPPDVEGDVGPNHYVEMVNQSWAVYSKSGTIAAGFPKSDKDIWIGFGNPVCAAQSRGDPIVMYDHLADRWILTEFAFAGEPLATGLPTPPFFECIAVSTSADPAGTYNRYSYEFTNFPDYPHLGIWPDAYYMSINQFAPPLYNYCCGGVAAFNRTKMLAGDPLAEMQFISRPNSDFSLLPADLDGTTLPPPGAPNPFFRLGDSLTTLTRYKFHVDWVTPANTTFTGPTTVSIAPFNLMCASCIPQPPVGGQTVQGLETLGDRLMHRLAYRNLGTHEAIVATHTVDDTGADHGAIRWYEIRDPNGTATVHQSGSFAPDGTHRWMPSIAMDQDGNIAVGYSALSTSVFPAIRYAGRLEGDPLNDLSQGEAILQAGGGSMFVGLFGAGRSSSRWGDYSAMQMDPTDDCTVWYINEYFAVNHDYDWHTRVGSFKFPSCLGPTAVGVASFIARRSKAGVTLQWRTASEAKIAGFNVWRSNGTAWRKVNARLVAAKRSGEAAGANYRFVDRLAGRGSRYRLQLVDLNGTARWHSARAAAR